MFSPDNSLVAKVVPSPSSEVGKRPDGSADILGVVLHMAEGGGTVSWLTRPDGNSSHYVVEYSGRIVQMVRERDWAGSLNPRTIRTTDDSWFEYRGETIVYGRTAVVKAIGAGPGKNPNRYLIAIEIEGFAATGPNGEQRLALHKLIEGIRSRRGPLPCLGHRDFQQYKKCPGKKIPWADYGGHGVSTTAPIPSLPDTSTEEVMRAFSVPEEPTRVWLKDLASRPGEQSRWLYTTSGLEKDGKEISLDPNRPLKLVGFVNADVYIVAYEPTGNDKNDTSTAMYVKSNAIERTEVIGTADPALAYTEAQLGDAVEVAISDERDRIRGVLGL